MGFADAIKPKLLAQAPEIPVRQDKKLDFYISMAFTYREQGKEFVEKGDYERAYICLMRFCNVVTITIPAHRHYKLEKYKRDKTLLKSSLINALEVLEQITARLERKYEQENANSSQEEISVPEETNTGVPIPNPGNDELSVKVDDDEPEEKKSN
jgi:hypothetical protein